MTFSRVIAAVLAFSPVLAFAGYVERYAGATWGDLEARAQERSLTSDVSVQLIQSPAEAYASASASGGVFKLSAQASMAANERKLNAGTSIVLRDMLTTTGTGSRARYRITFSFQGEVFSDRPGDIWQDAYSDATFSISSRYGGLFDDTASAYSRGVSYLWGQPAPAQSSFTTILDTYIGDEVTVSINLSNSVFGNVYSNWGKPAAFARVNNTALFSIEPLSGDYTAETGTVYVVPEPAMGLPLIGVLALLKRRNR